MLLADVDVWDSALAGDFLESALDSSAVLYLRKIMLVIVDCIEV